jgi:predicted SnoaL-like aldol condensation-catalyzing enzyme
MINLFDSVMNNAKEQCVIDFIDRIWNNGRFDETSRYLHPSFKDHGLPVNCQNQLGFILYLKALGKECRHQTSIEDIACEGNMVMVRFKIESVRLTEELLETRFGHRYFRMEDDQIIDHWEVFDNKW